MPEHQSLTARIGGPQSNGQTAPLPQEGTDRELRLKFADFEKALPASLLNADAVQSDADLVFDLAMVGELVTSGCSKVPIAWLKQRVPSFFCDATLPDGFATVDFPWQKILRLLRAALHPTSADQTTDYRELTPTGAKYLASMYQVLRAEARFVRGGNLIVPAGESPAPLATPSTEPADDPSRPPQTSPSPVGLALRNLGQRTINRDANLPATELIRQRDLARHQLACVSEEAERLLNAARAEFKAMMDERDDALAALAIFSGYESEHVAQLEIENAAQKKDLERALAELAAIRARSAA